MRGLKKYKYLVLVFLVIALLPYFFISFYAQPIAEDFGFATYYIKNDFVELIKDAYNGMNGRYIANIFMFCGPLSYGNFQFYKWIPILQIVLMLASVCVLVKRIFKYPALTTLTVALMFTLLFLNNLPIISEGLYWYTGSVIYMLGLSFSIFYYSLLIPSLKSGQTHFGKQLLMTFLLFLTCGFNETLTLLTLFFLSILTWYFHIKHSKNNPIIVVQLFLGIAFSSVMFFAPGNITRDALYVDNHKVLHSAGYSILQIIRFMGLWIISLPLITSSLFFLINFNKIKPLIDSYMKGVRINKWVLLLVLLFMIFICVFPAYWVTGILGQHRTLNVAYFFFIPIWFWVLYLFVSEINVIQKIIKPLKRYNRLLMLTLIISLIFTNNGLNIMSDIFTGEASEFNQTLHERHLKLFEAKKTMPNEIVFQPIAQPKTLFVTDISKDPNFWTNRGYNDYFNLSFNISVEPINK